MKSRKSVALFALIAVIFASTSLFAAEAKGEKEATASTKITGEVIDSACYIKSGAKGPNHAECAESCAKAGIPLAILEKGTDKVVWVSADKDMVGANEMLIPFAGKNVTLTGKWYERGGAKLFSIEKIEAAK